METTFFQKTNGHHHSSVLSFKKRKFAFGGYELFLKLIIDFAQA